MDLKKLVLLIAAALQAAAQSLIDSAEELEGGKNGKPAKGKAKSKKSKSDDDDEESEEDDSQDDDGDDEGADDDDADDSESDDETDDDDGDTEEESDDDDSEGPSVDDVRKAIKKYGAKTSNVKAKALLKKVGGVDTVSDLSPKKFQKVLDACKKAK